jgi:hypothetical protein
VEATALQLLDVVAETVLGRLAEGWLPGCAFSFIFDVPSHAVYRCMLVGDDSSAQWMVALVRETLHGKREGDEVQGQAKARRLVRAHCLSSPLRPSVELMLACSCSTLF